MRKKQIVIMFMIVLASTVIPSLVSATSITECDFEREYYYPGQTGVINVTVYNDRDYRIRITELTASIDYYYVGGVAYEQTFYTNATLPIEVLPGQSQTLFIPFSLPTNIAPGYTQLYVRATNQLWNVNSGTWFGAEYPSYHPTLYIESPYKREFEDLQATNNLTTIMVYVLGVSTLVFAVLGLSLYLISKRMRAIRQAAPTRQ